MNNIRLRFPPSPTGFLHVGSLRTVLFNHLIAKKLGGKLILRIEDTDQARKVEGAVEALYSILDWIGIKFDEGPREGGAFEPYTQSERREIYDKYARELVDKKLAYKCFCTSVRLDEMRKGQADKKLPPRYDGKCRDLSEDEINEKTGLGMHFVIRQKMPITGEIKVQDELRGEIVFRAEDMEDHVLIKSDGMPTYHFAVVVDDHLMEISHVLRGEEWIPSFPKHIELYKAFGWEPPKFIHLALTLNKSGGKLSKRQGDVAVEDFRAKGYLRETLINFSLLLGWHPRDGREIFSLEEAVRDFEIKDMGTSPAVFDIEKLDYLNGYYIRQLAPEKLAQLARPFIAENLDKTQDASRKTDEHIAKVVRLEQERIKKLADFKEATEFFFSDALEYPSELLVWKKSTPPATSENLKKTAEILSAIPDGSWTKHSIEDAMLSHIRAVGGSNGDWLWPMRYALTGRPASPGPFEVAEVLGKSLTIKRIKDGAEKLGKWIGAFKYAI
jgi:glutamyl-tRNA synthetase